MGSTFDKPSDPKFDKTKKTEETGRPSYPELHEAKNIEETGRPSYPELHEAKNIEETGRPSHPELDKTKKTDRLYYPELDETKKTKLNTLFEEIVTKVSIDYNNQEIQDIQTAVHTMLRRVVTRVNERGIFTISCIQPCGSMAEKTAIWKYKTGAGEIYTEFDFLAVLDGSPETILDHDCGVCVEVCKLPGDLEAQMTRLDENIISKIKYGIMREGCDRLFWREVNSCLVSSCNCFSVEFDTNVSWRHVSYEVTSKAGGLHNQYGCNKCVVEMPTGILRMNNSVSVGRGGKSIGIVDCSMVFLWSSKTENLSVYDQLLHEKVQPINTLLIHVDFLPALELFKPIPDESGYEHDFFIVPKCCGRCWRGGQWRKSSCMAEIAYIVSKMSEKHRKCYKIMKYFLSFVDKYPHIKWYHVKTIP